MALPPPEPDHLAGRRLYGEALDEAALGEWFASEETGYAALAEGRGDRPASAFWARHVFPHLPPQRFGHALALGAADGGELAPLAPRIERFTVIEPGRGFWRPMIAGVPAAYRMPTLRGRIELPDGSCDMATALGVLHHIPNVSDVVAELARVLAPGAPLVLREPIVSLGDFRGPRPGLTAHERGIPRTLMERILAEAGFTVVARSLLVLPAVQPLARRLGVRDPWESRGFVALDALLARALGWNARYWRPHWWDKLAPTTGCWVARRNPLS